MSLFHGADQPSLLQQPNPLHSNTFPYCISQDLRMDRQTDVSNTFQLVQKCTENCPV